MVDPVRSCCPDGMTRDSGDRCSRRPSAADIADDKRPTVLCDREHVVEVAADLAHRTSSPIANRDRDTGDVGQLAGQQRGLKRCRNATLLVEQPGIVERFGEPPSSCLRERDVLVVVMSLRFGADELHRADDAALGQERHGDQARQLQFVDDRTGLVGTRIPRVCKGPFQHRVVEIAEELGLAGAHHLVHPEQTVRIVRVLLLQPPGPLDSFGVGVSNPLFVHAGLREVVQQAPIAQPRHSGRRRARHQFEMITRGESNVVERRDELQPLALQALLVRGLFGLAQAAGSVGLSQFALRHVTAAADGAGDIAVGIGGDFTATLQPANAAIGHDDAMLDVVRCLFGHGTLDDGKDVVDFFRVEQCDVVVEGAAERARLEAEQPLHRRIPGRDARSLVPLPRTQLPRGQGEPQTIREVGSLLPQPKRFLGVFCRADGTHNVATRIAQRAEERSYFQDLTGSAQHLDVARPGVALEHRRHDLAPGPAQVWRDDQLIQRLPDRLVGPPPVQFLRKVIPRNDRANSIDDDDCPRKGVEQRLALFQHHADHRGGAFPGHFPPTRSSDFGQPRE